MKYADWIVDFLLQKGITDAFGLPGGVILELLYAMDRRKGEFSAHLSYHEQAAAFSACGYAQAKGLPGVAYATRGPGFTNLVTGIADAYYDSIPTLFFTAHSVTRELSDMRIQADQELDPIPLASGITKAAIRVEKAEDVIPELERAYTLATSGRKGPVLLDFRTALFSEELHRPETPRKPSAAECTPSFAEIAASIRSHLKAAYRPVLLIGSGVRQSQTTEQVRSFAEANEIPVISSRIAQDAMPDSPMYFGYIGSHGTRYGNFILSKADLVIALGNRMSYPLRSSSFEPTMSPKKVIRIDIDNAEFHREIPNSINYAVPLQQLLPHLLPCRMPYHNSRGWLAVCNRLKDSLWQADTAPPVNAISAFLRTVPPDAIITGDVGNAEFWLSRAYTHAGCRQPILYSNSFGALGCSLAKAIGAHYATGNPVICFAGDQGLQLNIQELQAISSNRLPILIVLINNRASGMIRCHEEQRFGRNFVHTTEESGYLTPDFSAIASAYRLNYVSARADNEASLPPFTRCSLPCLVEVSVDEEVCLQPNLLKGQPCQALSPALPETLYGALDAL